MTRCRFVVSAALLAAVVFVPVAQARDIYVHPLGDNGWPGTSTRPYRTIKYAVQQSVAGDVIRVHAGTYAESWIQVKSGTRIVSEDGLYAAKVNAGGSTSFRFENGCTDAEVDGFEVYSTWSAGSPADGLVRAWNCSNIRIRNMKVHDAPYDADCIKIGGWGATTTNVLVENCVVYNPAYRGTGPAYQENIDIFPADGVTVRGCWLYHTPERGGDDLIFAKGGSTNIIWENNVFGPSQSPPYSNPAVMCGTASPNVFPSCENFVARNNLFLGLTGDGAFAFLGARNAHLYNNVFYDYRGGRCVIEFYHAGVLVPNEDCYVYNNIFVQSNGYPIYQDRGRWDPTISYIPVNFQHDHNIYWQANDGGDVNIQAEANSLFVDPMLVAPAVPVPGVDTWATIVARFELQDGSPAKDAGFDLGPLVPTDVYGMVRPVGPAYDIGAQEVPWAGDLNRDGSVNAIDLLIMAHSWLKSEGEVGYDPAADINGDNTVNAIDLLALAKDWGK